MKRPLVARIETLEPRQLLNADWHNNALRCDVDDSGLVSPLDVLLVVNSLNSNGSRPLGMRAEGDPFLDVSGDNFASPIDALLIVNALNNDTGQPSIVTSVSPGDDPNSNGVVLKDQVTIEGTTRANATVRIGNGDGERLLEALSDESGRFRTELSVDRGYNVFELSVQDEIGRVAETKLEVRRGDLVTDWNAAILNVVREWTTVSDDPYEGRIVPSEPPRVARNMAMMHIAMFDAMNASTREFESYLSVSPPTQEVVPEIAAAHAAYKVAASVYSDADSMAYWNATLIESLAGYTNSDLAEASEAYGVQVGSAMLQTRNADGSDENVSYSHGDAPGDWQRTFPGYLPPLLPQWDQVQTFSGVDVNDFRPPPPPDLASEAYANAVDEVYRLGGLTSDVRTEEQTEIAVFWVDGAGTFTPPGHWNQIAADVLLEREISHLETARTFALLNLALADAGIAAWDAK
ncbi:MAG TPA: hypothetical protein DDW52_14320 [Planctomycetaceae bacterium]|nr:hypothetical protein [Planctomycetaceae bacterium]